MCSICMSEFNSPSTLECNHQFCSKCILDWLTTYKNDNCPLCRKYVSNKYKTIIYHNIPHHTRSVTKKNRYKHVYDTIQSKLLEVEYRNRRRQFDVSTQLVNDIYKIVYDNPWFLDEPEFKNACFDKLLELHNDNEVNWKESSIWVFKFKNLGLLQSNS